MPIARELILKGNPVQVFDANTGHRLHGLSGEWRVRVVNPELEGNHTSEQDERYYEHAAEQGVAAASIDRMLEASRASAKGASDG